MVIYFEYISDKNKRDNWINILIVEVIKLHYKSWCIACCIHEGGAQFYWRKVCIELNVDVWFIIIMNNVAIQSLMNGLCLTPFLSLLTLVPIVYILCFDGIFLIRWSFKIMVRILHVSARDGDDSIIGSSDEKDHSYSFRASCKDFSCTSNGFSVQWWDVTRNQRTPSQT